MTYGIQTWRYTQQSDIKINLHVKISKSCIAHVQYVTRQNVKAIHATNKSHDERIFFLVSCMRVGVGVMCVCLRAYPQKDIHIPVIILRKLWWPII